MRINCGWRHICNGGPIGLGILLLAVTLLITSFPTKVQAEDIVAADSKEVISPCKGLKPFKNIDELLHQFYINRDNLCLFKMPPSELEKIWGVKILAGERIKPKNLSPLSETEFYYKPYKTDKDAFYIELRCDPLHGNRFAIRPTKEYLNKFGSIYPEGLLPNGLPMFDTSPAKTSADHPISDKTFPVTYIEEKNLSITLDDVRGIRIFNPTEIFTYYSEGAKADRERLRELGKDCSCFLTIPPDCTWFYNATKADVDNYSTPGSDKSEILPVSDEEAKNAPCRALRPFDNIEELLYQFYINLDSDCLFNLPREELEKIWGLKVLKVENGTKEDHNKSDYMDKPYNTEKDAFYIELSHFLSEESDLPHITFRLYMTIEYRKLYGTFFFDGHLPRLLPQPISEPDRMAMDVVGTPQDEKIKIEMRKKWPPALKKTVLAKGDFNYLYGNYYWFNSNLSSEIYLRSNILTIKNYVSPHRKARYSSL